jgi:hypothetical protein
MCKVQWSHHTKEDATWEREKKLIRPAGFFDPSESRDEIHFKGVSL